MAANRILDDIARLLTDATGAAQGVKREVETVVKGQMERVLRDMDVANREEVEVLRDLVTSLKAETDMLRARVATLESQASRPVVPKSAANS